MAQYSFPAVQTVAVNQNVLMMDNISCCKGNVIHRAGSGVFTVKGASQQSKARYRVTYNGNVSLDAAGQAELAITLNGETLQNAVGAAFPAAADNFFNVTMDVVIDIPCGCCFTIAVKNIGTTVVNVRNSNLIIDRIC